MTIGKSILKNETLVTVGAITLLAVSVVWMLKKSAVALVDTAGGVISGNNAITAAARTTAYQGAGVVGTLGAATDIASGGILSRIGEYIGETTYKVTHNPTEQARTTAYQGAGPVGTVGAVTDIISGGTLSKAGEAIGGWVYDATHWSEWK